MVLTYPAGHKPRYENFELKGFLDEPLREGANFTKDLIENDKFIEQVLNVVQEKMNAIYQSKREDFTEINEKIIEFYFTDVMSAVDIIEISNNLSIAGSIS